MFGQRHVKNRRFTPKEFQEELQEAGIWRRRPRTYIFDPPDYKLDVIEPIVNFGVNFELNFKF